MLCLDSAWGLDWDLFPPLAVVLIKNIFIALLSSSAFPLTVAYLKNDIGAGGGTQGLGKDIEVVSTVSIIFFYHGEERSQANMEGKYEEIGSGTLEFLILLPLLFKVSRERLVLFSPPFPVCLRRTSSYCSMTSLQLLPHVSLLYTSSTRPEPASTFSQETSPLSLHFDGSAVSHCCRHF